MFGSVKYSKEAQDVSYAEFYDSNGEMVASFSNGRWISYGTKAEDARESELWGIYNQAWNSAARAKGELRLPLMLQVKQLLRCMYDSRYYEILGAD